MKLFLHPLDEYFYHNVLVISIVIVICHMLSKLWQRRRSHRLFTRRRYFSIRLLPLKEILYITTKPTLLHLMWVLCCFIRKFVYVWIKLKLHLFNKLLSWSFENSKPNDANITFKLGFEYIYISYILRSLKYVLSWVMFNIWSAYKRCCNLPQTNKK